MLTRWLLTLPLCVSVLAAAYPVVKEEKVDRTFTFAEGAKREFRLRNINGSVRVTGVDAPQLRMVVNIRWRAESQARLDEARREYPLDIQQDGDGIRVCLHASRDCDGHEGQHGDRGYDFRHEFELQVPRGVALKLNTVSGDIVLDHTAGGFDLNTVNGKVDMLEVRGSGRAYALNGGVTAAFVQNPAEASYFGSLNGKVQVAFQPNFAAKALLKSFNGSFYTDFPVVALATAPEPAEPGRRENGKWVYRSRGYRAVQIGQGGPEIKFDTFNGDVHILSRAR
jgi:hypothetical protein